MSSQNSNILALVANDDESRYVNEKRLIDDEFDSLQKMNSIYAHTTAGSKHVIVSLKKDAINNETFSLEPITEFKNRFLHEAKIAGMNKGEAWLRWSGKRYFPDGLGYYPTGAECPKTKFNMYTDLAVSPLPGNVTPYLRHIKDVICSGQDEVADYLLDFLAHLVQKPYEKPSVAIVMKSDQGAGKGSMMKPIELIFGNNFTQTNGANLIAGRFNGAICNRLVVFADEVDLTYKKIADRFKALISENTVFLEHKGLDPVAMPNYMRFIFASNHEQVLLAGNRERRYLVLEPSGHLAQDKAYFDDFYQWLDNDGAAHLLDYLQRRDISDFDPRRAPVTQALRDEILVNLPVMDSYVLHELCLKLPFGACRVTPDHIRIRLEDYLLSRGFAKETEPQLRSRVGKMAKRYGIESSGKRGVNLLYHLPEPESFRAKFASMFGVNPNDLF